MNLKNWLAIDGEVDKQFAERLYEEEGKVGFWYFYKDAVTSHFETLQDNLFEGPKNIVVGITLFLLGIVMVLALIVMTVIIPFMKVRKAWTASMGYKKYVEEHYE